jgi:tetratricopeptide (TPR) repeat protein
MRPQFRPIPQQNFGRDLLGPKANAKLQRAIALHQKGQLPQAQALYEKILRLQPKHFDVFHLLGVIAYQTGNPRRAVDLIGNAIALNPSNPAFYSNRGAALHELRELDAAVASYDAAIALKADYAEAYYNRGNALRELKRLDAAIANYDKAIALKPDYVEAHCNRGIALHGLKQFDDAIASYAKALALKPDYADAYYNRGNALHELKQLDAALASYDKAVALKPDLAEAYSNRGILLQELKQLDAAIASYDKAIALQTDFAEAYSHRGNAFTELRQADAALASFDMALALKPDHAEAHWNKSWALLLFGHLDSGWQEYEWRWKNDALESIHRHFPQPLWLGRQPLANKSILLHSEQGFGDTIQFCRYAKLVADLGARVILEVEQPLVRLLANLQGVGRAVTKGDALPAFDYQTPLLSLPLAFRTTLDTIPATTGYLRADRRKTAQWQSRLGEKTKPRIGLVWNGSAGHKNDRNRSILLSHLIQYLPADLQYVSLQKEIRTVDQPTIESNPQLITFANDLIDFSDTAALCKLMDVVISVDTSVAHLAGALGKPTWVLLPFTPDWRWLLDRTDSPWYPSAKLYRQGKIGDWDGVLERLKGDLLHLASTGAKPLSCRG